MIAASEPLEFVPHGRRALQRHPGSVLKPASSIVYPSENSLLHKLKNVVITDRSGVTTYLHKEDTQNEWWTVRQICANKKKECKNAKTEKTPAAPKEDYAPIKAMDTDNPSLKLRNDLSLSIKNELSSGLKKLGNDSNIPGSSRLGSTLGGSTSTKASSSSGISVSLDDGPVTVKSMTECCFEEELYVKGKTAVWSRGDISNPETKFYDPESRVTIACYTCESPIKHALFCNFFTSISDKLIHSVLNDLSTEVDLDIDVKEKFEEKSQTPIPSICLIDTTCIRVFMENGQDFISSLQFQVKRVWSTKYGILLEKEAAPPADTSYFRSILNTKSKANFSVSKTLGNRSSIGSGTHFHSTNNSLPTISNTFVENDIPLPTCFSLSHPLEELTPILVKPSQFSSVQYYNDGANQIIFISDYPSIALIFNNKTGLHSLYAVRKSTMEECHFVCSNWNKTATIMSPSEHFGNSMSMFNATSHHKGANTGHKNTEASWLSGISSPYASKQTSVVGSPAHTRTDNPMAGMFHKLGLSPHTSTGQASNTSMIAPNTRALPLSQPLYPDICFEHIWTERQTPTASSSGITNWSSGGQAFLHKDYTGQHYLCYTITSSAQSLLQVARLENSHSVPGDDTKKHLIVGTVTSIPVKDAVVLPSLNLIVVLNPSDNILLYSGTCFMGKIHIGGVLAGLITSPYNQSNVFDSSFPRRSSLIPSAHPRDVPTLDDSTLHQLSPVPKQHGHNSLENKSAESTGIQKLRDAVGNRVTLEYGKGVFYRVTLPDLTSNSLIKKCINALKQILQKDVVMKVISQWYGIRNAPGTQDLCPKLEWSMFISLMFSLLGYDIAKLPLTKQRDTGTPEVATKKQRTSNDGSQEDWEYLLKSNHHISLGSSLASMLNLRKQNNVSDPKLMPNGLELSEVVNKISGISRKVASRMDLSNVEDQISEANFNMNSLLFPYTLPILFAFHLVYEELKMNVLLVDSLEPLARFLHQLSTDLKLSNYVCHYWKDFPSLCKLEGDASQTSQLTENDLKSLNQPAYFTNEPPSIFKHVYELMMRNNKVRYPYLELVNGLSRDIIEITELIVDIPRTVLPVVSAKENVYASSTPRVKPSTNSSNFGKIEEAVVLKICEKGYTLKDLQTLPPSVNLFILNTISRCKTSPPVDWTDKEYSLIMREDLALRAKVTTVDTKVQTNNAEDSLKESMFTKHKELDSDGASLSSKQSENEKTGLEHIDTRIMRLRFPDDHRVSELCNMLQSSNPVTIALTQRPEVSDHDFIEEQERYLLALCNRTMALSVGRGMVTLRSTPCVITEPLHIPKLCLTGRAPPRNAVIDLSHIEVSPTVSQWPLFHNGVAAGLKLVPQGIGNIESAWVVYNKPKVGSSQDLPTDHAGFLMALGLNGHLKDMALQNVYEYLVKCHEMTSVGLLLGIASTYRGTMDVRTTKLIGIHVEALLPPTSMELDIPQNIQVAALMGVGLLYQKTSHTHMTQVLLSEIGRPPGPEMENSSEREGYSLAAGLALGLVVLGGHATAPQFLTSSLTHYMLGGKKRPLTGSQKEKYKLASFQIREGPTVNVDVTAPGATLALGMLYMKSGNTQVAKWLEPPPTHYLLNHCRPDLLLLRVIARGLIIWDSIEPYEEWVEDYIPESIKPYCCVRPNEEYSDIDYEAMNQVYCNIVAGACFSIGLRYAGSANQDAKDTLMFYAKKLIMLGSKSIGELAGKATTETCLNLVLLSAAMVMAGTGDLDVMRVCRHQRSKAGPGCMSLSYGSQLAVHAALGLLFLGGGRYTLSTSSEAIAALVCAFFPKFPLHSNDNRYHLQAFRHLYVLAAEPRLLIPRDIFSGKICYVNVQVITLNTRQILNLKGPCLLPELDKLEEVRIADDRYWSIVFKRDRNWDQLISLLKNSICLDIKQRAGCLSYLEDPHGFQSLLAQMLTTEKKNVWSAKPENILAFSSDQTVVNFTKHYLYDALSKLFDKEYDIETSNKTEKPMDKICSTCYFQGVTRIFKESDKKFRRRESATGSNSRGERTDSFSEDSMICVCDKNNKEEREFIQLLTVITYECVVRDTLVILPIWITLVKMLRNLPKNPSVNHLWQLKLVLAHIANHNNQYNMTADGAEENEEKINIEPLISNEFALSIQQKLEFILDSWQSELTKNLKRFLQNVPIVSERTLNVKKLASYVTFYDIPKGILGNDVSNVDVIILELFMQKDKWNLSSSTVQKIADVFILPNTSMSVEV